MEYTAPTADQVLALKVCAGIAELAEHDRFAGASEDMVEAIVEGIGALAAGEWAPLNRAGDTQGARLVDGRVELPAGFAEAYRAYVEAGWGSISAPADFGGQSLPMSLAACVLENLGTANMAFNLLPMLTVGAIEAIAHHGSPAQQATYLPRLISGEWSGTMNLTEPQAGSDVGALRSIATPIDAGEHAGKYRIKGTKIFITWGEHDLASNIVHLVLARTPGVRSPARYARMVFLSRPRCRAIAEIVQPRLRSACASMSSSRVSMQTGLPRSLVVVRDRQHRREPHPQGGPHRWGISVSRTEEIHPSAIRFKSHPRHTGNAR